MRIDLSVAADPTRPPQDIEAAIAIALGVADEDPFDDLDAGRRGLLHWRMRNFGDNVHGSQVCGAGQNVPGVRWVRLDRLAPSRAASLDLLTLQRRDLRIRFAGDVEEVLP